MDGVYTEDAEGELRFQSLPTPTAAEVSEIAERTDSLQDAQPGLFACYQAAEVRPRSRVVPHFSIDRHDDRAQPLDDDAPPLFSGVTQFAGGGEYAVRTSLAPTPWRESRAKPDRERRGALTTSGVADERTVARLRGTQVGRPANEIMETLKPQGRGFRSARGGWPGCSPRAFTTASTAVDNAPQRSTP